MKTNAEKIKSFKDQKRYIEKMSDNQYLISNGIFIERLFESNWELLNNKNLFPELPKELHEVVYFLFNDKTPHKSEKKGILSDMFFNWDAHILLEKTPFLKVIDDPVMTCQIFYKKNKDESAELIYIDSFYLRGLENVLFCQNKDSKKPIYCINNASETVRLINPVKCENINFKITIEKQ